MYWGARMSVKEQFRTLEVGYRGSTLAPPNPNGSPAAAVTTFARSNRPGPRTTLGGFDLQAASHNPETGDLCAEPSSSV